MHRQILYALKLQLEQIEQMASDDNVSPRQRHNAIAVLQLIT